jgi:hypothetical protein
MAPVLLLLLLGLLLALAAQLGRIDRARAIWYALEGDDVDDED